MLKRVIIFAWLMGFALACGPQWTSPHLRCVTAAAVPLGVKGATEARQEPNGSAVALSAVAAATVCGASYLISYYAGNPGEDDEAPIEGVGSLPSAQRPSGE